MSHIENPSTSGGGGSGTVTSFSFTDGNGFTSTVTNPTTTPDLSLVFQDAKADDATLGQATFKASDFNDNGSGLISIDYTNGQAADATHKGFLTSTDWSTFNSKLTFLPVKEDGSLVSSATALDFIEPDAVLVTDSPADTARIDMSQYFLYVGRVGAQTAILSKNQPSVLVGTDASSGGEDTFAINPTNEISTDSGKQRGLYLDYFQFDTITLDTCLAAGTILGSNYLLSNDGSSSCAHVAHIHQNTYQIGDNANPGSAIIAVASLFMGCTLEPGVDTNETLDFCFGLALAPMLIANGTGILSVSALVAVREGPDATDTLINVMASIFSQPSLRGSTLVSNRFGLLYGNPSISDSASVDTSICIFIDDPQINTLGVGIQSFMVTDEKKFFIQERGGAKSEFKGKFTKYHDDVTAGNGMVSVIGQDVQTGQTGDISPTVLVAAGTGTYLVSLYLLNTVTGTSGSVFASVLFGDETGSHSLDSTGQTLDNAGTFVQHTFFIHTDAGNISYSTTTAGITGSPEYAIYINVMRVS